MLNKDNIKEFYNSIYKKGDIRDNPRLYRGIIRLVNPSPHTRLLDVGCGVGCLLYEANKRNVKAYGLDISLAALNKAVNALPFVKVCVGDGEKLPFKSDSFDTAVSLGSIEHFLLPEKGIKEIGRVIKLNGRVVLLLPNSFYLGDILKIFFKGKTDAPWQIQEKLLTKEGWRALIEENGLCVEKIYGYNKYPELFQEGTFKLKSISKYINVFLMRYFCPFNLSWQFVYICKKVNESLR